MALALGRAVAHVRELPNKIGMSREDYFIVLRVYLGWNCLAYLLLIELAGMLAEIFLYRPQPNVLWPALIALGCLVAAQAISWVFTFPTNQAQAIRLSGPRNWETLRWHLAGGTFQTFAMAALIVAALRRGRQGCFEI